MQDVTCDILVVDDEKTVCGLIQKALEGRGLSCTTTTDSQEAREMLRRHRFSVLVADVVMSDFGGIELLSYCRQHVPDCRVILITGMAGTKDLAHAISLGAYDYFQKPFDLNQLGDSVHDALSGGSDARQLPVKAAQAMQLAAQLKQIAVETIGALVQTVEAKDPYTRKHSEQVARYAVDLAHRLGLPDKAVKSIRVAALLHDIGKIGVPDQILTKPGRLSQDEYRLIQRHPVLGSEILQNISIFADEAMLVRHHHEAWDGSGYPDGLAGEEIPLAARILNIADSIDAMLMQRTYKEAYSIERTLGELVRCAGTQFDPRLAAVALEWAQHNPQLFVRPGNIEGKPASC